MTRKWSWNSLDWRKFLNAGPMEDWYMEFDHNPLSLREKILKGYVKTTKQPSLPLDPGRQKKI